ncbi:DUF4190 domain-containing protein, partial [Cellulomonas carbonis]
TQPYGAQPGAYGQPDGGAGWAPAPGYGAGPGYGAPAAPKSNGMAVTALVIGIIALLLAFIPVVGVISVLLGIVAIVLGIMGRRRVVPGVVGGKGLAIGGIVTGALGLVIGLVVSVILGLLVNAAVTDEDFQRELEEEIERLEEGSDVNGGATTEEEATDVVAEEEAAAERVDFSFVTCELLADEAVLISAEAADGELLEVKDAVLASDERETYVVPTGTDEAVVMGCTGTGVWSDGTEQPVALELSTDATGEAYVYYAAQ